MEHIIISKVGLLVMQTCQQTDSLEHKIDSETGSLAT
jgi:hypothetical protein